MPACKLKSANKTRIHALSASILAIALSSNVYALEDGFIGLHLGSTSSLDADSTSNSFKILTGAHVTSRITLEFGYLNLGKMTYDNPTPYNKIDDKYNNTALRNSVGEVSPEGGLINLRYRLPMGDKFDFFVKTGFFAWAADYQHLEEFNEDNNVKRVEEKSSQASGADTISGAGFIYRPIPQLSIRTELETTVVSSIEIPRARLQNITLGVNWEF